MPHGDAPRGQLLKGRHGLRLLAGHVRGARRRGRAVLARMLLLEEFKQALERELLISLRLIWEEGNTPPLSGAP